MFWVINGNNNFLFELYKWTSIICVDKPKWNKISMDEEILILKTPKFESE